MSQFAGFKSYNWRCASKWIYIVRFTSQKGNAHNLNFANCNYKHVKQFHKAEKMEINITEKSFRNIMTIIRKWVNFTALEMICLRMKHNLWNMRLISERWNKVNKIEFFQLPVTQALTAVGLWAVTT